jgi:hypothetical protein
MIKYWLHIIPFSIKNHRKIQGRNNYYGLGKIKVILNSHGCLNFLQTTFKYGLGFGPPGANLTTLHFLHNLQSDQ